MYIEREEKIYRQAPLLVPVDRRTELADSVPRRGTDACLYRRLKTVDTSTSMSSSLSPASHLLGRPSSDRIIKFSLARAVECGVRCWSEPSGDHARELVISSDSFCVSGADIGCPMCDRHKPCCAADGTEDTTSFQDKPPLDPAQVVDKGHAACMGRG